MTLQPPFMATTLLSKYGHRLRKIFDQMRSPVG
jgi:hypothetical protein